MKEVIIIGGGPCGVSTALYLKRAGIDVTIIESSVLGGQVALTTELENYAGFYEKDAFVFCENLQKQVDNLHIEVVREKAIKVEQDGRYYRIICSKSIFESKVVVISIGCEPRKLNIESEQRFIGNGESFCAICDGNFYKGLKVGVVGGGNSAFEDANYLAKLASKVYLIHRSEDFKAEKVLIKDLKAKNNVEMLLNKQVKEIKGEDYVTSIILEDTKTQKLEKVDLDGLFVAIGRIPSSAFLKDFIKLNQNGFIEVNDNFETSKSGVFAGGDCIVKTVRQVSTAVADGAMLSKSIISYLEGN